MRGKTCWNSPRQRRLENLGFLIFATVGLALLLFFGCAGWTGIQQELAPPACTERYTPPAFVHLEACYGDPQKKECCEYTVPHIPCRVLVCRASCLALWDVYEHNCTPQMEIEEEEE